MRILHVVGDSGFGGASRGIVALVTQWTENQWEADLLATDATFQEFAREAGVKVIPLDCIWRRVSPIKDLWGALRLYRYLRRERYDVVHTHTTKAGFVGRICARLARVPVIIHTVHGFAFHETSPSRKILFYSLLERMAARCCTHVVTVSHFHRQWLIDLGIASGDCVTAIPNGVFAGASGGEALLADAPEHGATRIVCVGRLAREKGLEDLIDAATLMRNRPGPRFVIEIVGDGLLRDELETRCKSAGVTDCVRLTGFQADVCAVLRSADIVIQPSIREGLSISLLEGMAEGKPIIATSISSNVEATGGGRAALLVPPHCPEHLAFAMETLMLDPEYARTIAAHARERFETHYTLQRMLDDYKRLYDRLCDQKIPERHRPPVLSEAGF